MKRITIIVPCYNEEEVLDFFYEEVTKYLDPKYDFKLLFVNDGSKDKTSETTNNLRKKDDRIKYISISRNFGKEAAMTARLQGAKELNSDACIMLNAKSHEPTPTTPEISTSSTAGHRHIK